MPPLSVSHPETQSEILTLCWRLNRSLDIQMTAMASHECWRVYRHWSAVPWVIGWTGCRLPTTVRQRTASYFHSPISLW